MSKVFLKRQMKQSAAALRNAWGMTPFEAIRLKSFLLQKQVLTVFKPLEGAISGMALKVEKENDVSRFMLINSNCTLGRQHFTICHELYHLFVQENFSSQVCNTGKFKYNDIEELKADWFASYFLLPEEGVLKMIPRSEMSGKDKISLATLLLIEQYFSCSRSALTIRLEDLHLITKDYSKDLRLDIIRNARRHGYSHQLYRSGNGGQVIGNYGEMAYSLFDEEKISEMNYASLMADIGIDVFDENINNEQSENPA